MLENLFPIHAGMLPTNSFSATSSVINFVQFFNEIGSLPDRLLLRMCNDSSKLKAPMESGMLPLSLLLLNFIATKYCQLDQQSGITPDKRFSPRLRTCIFFNSSILWHKKLSMEPENELLERSNAPTLENILGNGPLN
jgi:hypothetical protein